MKKGIIVYQSKYGSTKKYVNWFKTMVNYDVLQIKEANLSILKNYEIIIFMGGFYASGISGLFFLRKNYYGLKNKKVAVFGVGASPYDPATIQQVRHNNFKEELSELTLFYGRGAWNEEKMTFIDRGLCWLLVKSLSKKDPESYLPWQQALMSSQGQKVDWTNPKYLEPLLEFVNS
ncbi:MAG TPA: flavodoxin [Erysipelothrix sp.]|nr:flavodoxin [Erysipelothrix sp.]